MFNNNWLPFTLLLFIYLLCSHSEHQKNLFQSKHFHQKNQFTEYETSSNKVKLPKVGSSVMIVHGQGPTTNPVNMNKISSTDLVQVHNRLNDYSSSKWGATKCKTNLYKLPSTDPCASAKPPQWLFTPSSKWWTTKCKRKL